MTTDEMVKVVLPIATFILGGALTVTLKAFEQRRDVVRTAAREAARLTKEWYVQLHTLALVRPASKLDGAINTGIYDYVHNRLILPDFMLHLEVLRSKRKAAGLVDALDAFLNDVTELRQASPFAGSVEPLRLCRTAMLAMAGEPEPGTVAGLEVLDLHVQTVTREAAKLLH